MYLDITAPDGLVVRVTADEDRVAPAVQFGVDPPIPLAYNGRNLRACRTADGRHLAIWKGQNGIAYRAERGTRLVEAIGAAYADEPVALTPSGQPVVVVSPTHYLFGSQLRPLPDRVVGSTDGIRSADDDGTVIFGWDQLYGVSLGDRTRGPFVFLQWQDVGGWRIGKTNRGVIAWHESTATPYTVTTVNTPWAVRSVVVAGRIQCAVSLPDLVAHEHQFMPWQPVLTPTAHPCGVGAFFDHDRSFLTVPNDLRFPTATPLAKGVFLDLRDRDNLKVFTDVAEGLGVPLWAYTDGRPYDWSHCPPQAWPMLNAYLVPGQSYRQTMESIDADIAEAVRRRQPFAMALSLHRGPDGSGRYARGEAETIDVFEGAYEAGRLAGCQLFYVFAWKRPYDVLNPHAPVVDGILRFASFVAYYEALRAAVRSPDAFPERGTAPRASPSPSRSPSASRSASASPSPSDTATFILEPVTMDKTYALRAWNPEPTGENTNFETKDFTPRMMYLSLAPGGTALQWRDAARGWERVRITYDDGRQAFFEFEAANATFCVEEDGRFGIRPAGTRGSFEAMTGGLSPTGEIFFSRRDRIGRGPVVEVVEVA